MPTFFFYKNRRKVDEMQGADARELEDRINQWIGGAVDTVVRLLSHSVLRHVLWAPKVSPYDKIKINSELIPSGCDKKKNNEQFLKKFKATVHQNFMIIRIT